MLVTSMSAQARRPATIVDAAQFLEHMPKGTILSGRQQLHPDAWLFNNLAITLRWQAYLYAK